MSETKRGRKVNEEAKENLVKLFWDCNNVNEFVEVCALKESTARIYWYRLCKENDRVVKMKKGRKTEKVDYQKKYNELVEAIRVELEEAKLNKRSQAPFKKLLGIEC